MESFGAIADGHTDNTTFINNAVRSLRMGQTLSFPCTAGQFYLVRNPINFGSMQYMSMQGSGPGCDLEYVGSNAAPYAFGFAGAYTVDIRNMDFLSTNYGVIPETVLMLGRLSPNAASGSFKFNDVRVEGYATKAVVYSIASEENKWMDPTIVLNGGGALYGFYTSSSDDLGIDNLATASNLSLWMQNFHLMDFSSSIDSAHVLIVDVGDASGAGNHTFRDGYLGSQGGTGFEFASPGASSTAWMALTVDSNRFENGCQMFLFTGGGSFGDVSLTNNKTAGVSNYLINLPTTCYDCTFQGNNVNQGDPTVAVIGKLVNSHVSENYPFTVGSSTNSEVFNRRTGSWQLSGSSVQPACNASLEGTMWYRKGGNGVNGVFQLCQMVSSRYQWITH